MKKLAAWLNSETFQGMALMFGVLILAGLLWGPRVLGGKAPLSIVLTLMKSGWASLMDYVVAHAIPCLVPAFFIAGAIGVFVSQASVMRYFGAHVKPWLSYSVASVSGAVLAVCSCTVLPIFTGIYKRGAGLGPAVAFLYSGPAINVLAVIYSARLLGIKIGVARAVGAVLFSVVIGLVMAFIFRDEEREKVKAAAHLSLPQEERKGWITLVFFLVLFFILITMASHRYLMAAGLLVILAAILKGFHTKDDVKEWMVSTWYFVKLITPWLLVGVFVAGAIKVLLPPEVVTRWVGGNSLMANFLASFIGALMYFATLTEVPIIKALTQLGMGQGPALALLLAGPALSLPNMLVIRKVMGTKKALIYISLVVVMATISGMVFGKYFA